MIERELSMRSLDEKASFMEARMRKPDIVALESDPAAFYNYTLGNVTAATSLLTSYWSERKRLFGDMAFLPFVIASDGQPDGKISSQDLPALHSGFVQLLPPDSRGRRMVFLNLSLQPAFPLETLMRAIFLVLQSLLAGISQSSRDLVLLVLISNDFDATKNAEILRWTCRILANAMPLNLERLHVLKTGSSPSPGLLFSVIDQIVREGLAHEVVFTAAKSSAELFARVKPYGISPSVLPSVINGDFQWDPMIALRRSDPKTEGTASSGPSTEDSNMEGLSSSSARAATSSSAEDIQLSDDSKNNSKVSSSRGSPQQQELLDCNDEPSTERHRTRNAVYSRRKYLRKKIEQEVLETECARLKTENVDLKRESQRLEELWRAALEQVESHAPDHAKSEFPNSVQQAPSRRSIRPSPAASPVSTTASQFPQRTGQLPTRDHASLLAMSQANLMGQASSFNPSSSHGFLPMGPQGSRPFLQLNHSLQYGMDHLRSQASMMGATLPGSLVEERMRLLLPNSYAAQAVPPVPPHTTMNWPCQGVAAARSHNHIMLGTALGQQRQPTEEEIRRFLYDRAPEDDMRGSFR